MARVFTVFGALGNQGSSVIDAVLADPFLSKEYRLRAVTRDPTKQEAKDLASKGVEVVSANMDSPEAIAPAVNGAHTVFFMTNFWEHLSGEKELAQGEAVTDACKAAGVKQIIFSSLLSPTELTHGKLSNVKHFESKAQVEKYIRASGVPAVFYLPGVFMNNLLASFRPGEDGEYSWAIPMDPKSARFPLFDVRSDTGKYVKVILKKFPDLIGKQIYASSGYITPAQMAQEHSDVFGKPAKAIQVPNDVFKSFLPPPVAQELLENMLLIAEPGYYNGADLTQFISLLEEEPVSWKMFLEKNKQDQSSAEQ